MKETPVSFYGPIHCLKFLHFTCVHNSSFTYEAISTFNHVSKHLPAAAAMAQIIVYGLKSLAD